MNLKPLGNRVIGKKIVVEHKSGSILLAAPKIENTNRLEVISIGDKVLFLKVGDVALVDRYSSQSVMIGEEEYFFFKEEEAIGVEYENTTT